MRHPNENIPTSHYDPFCPFLSWLIFFHNVIIPLDFCLGPCGTLWHAVTRCDPRLIGPGQRHEARRAFLNSHFVKATALRWHIWCTYDAHMHIWMIWDGLGWIGMDRDGFSIFQFCSLGVGETTGNCTGDFIRSRHPTPPLGSCGACSKYLPVAGRIHWCYLDGLGMGQGGHSPKQSRWKQWPQVALRFPSYSAGESVTVPHASICFKDFESNGMQWPCSVFPEAFKQKSAAQTEWSSMSSWQSEQMSVKPLLLEFEITRDSLWAKRLWMTIDVMNIHE